MKQQTSNMAFSAKLLSVLSDQENSVISPHGIAAVLSMASAGASENCLREILTTLGFSCIEELQRSVCSATENLCGAFANENAITFVGENSEAKLLDQFKRSVSTQHSALVNEKTSDGEPYVELKNVASFKAEWLRKMERDASHEHSFYNADGSKSFPAFLSCTSQLRYYKDSNRKKPTVQAVALPYKYNDAEIPFELVLVDSDKPLTAPLLETIFPRMQTGKCEVEFPEFSINSEFDLVPMMKNLGLQSIFNPEVEAFDRMATIPLYAKSFCQEAEIQVDKAGTTARALTRMIAVKSLCLPDKEEIHFYRPFYYFLRNVSTGEILFMGRVNKLSDCDRMRFHFDLADFMK